MKILDWLKVMGTGIVFLLGIFAIIGGAIAVKLSWLTLIVLLILQLFGVISIGWMVLGYPLLMFFGGLLLIGINSLVIVIVGVTMSSI